MSRCSFRVSETFTCVKLMACKNFVHGAWFFCHAGKSQIYLKDGDFKIDCQI